nr:hypothetical protein [Tanacetum cinerariifolium]
RLDGQPRPRQRHRHGALRPGRGAGSGGRHRHHLFPARLRRILLPIPRPQHGDGGWHFGLSGDEKQPRLRGAGRVSAHQPGRRYAILRPVHLLRRAVSGARNAVGPAPPDEHCPHRRLDGL